MTERNTLMRRLAAGVGAFALATVGFLGAGMAHAAGVGGPGPDQPGHPTAGSLTIHKRVGAQGTVGDGTELAFPPGKALEGAEFTIWQLGVENEDGVCEALDMAEPEAWDLVPTGTAPTTLAGVQAAGFCLVDAVGIVSDATDEDGITEFNISALGLYYVDETYAPLQIVSKAAPFYVTIPLPHADGSWLYDVHAYPKNQELDVPEKTINPDVEQTGLVVGSTVEWTITQTVPALNEGEEYTSASIWDYLPTDGSLAYDSTVSVKVGDTTLVKDADYEIIATAAGVTWKLTDIGLGKINAGDTITVVFKTKVMKVTETGDINNPGSIDPEKPGYGSEFNGKPVPGKKVPYTYWGALKVTKVAQNGGKLKGAEFQVFPFPMTGTECSDKAPATGLVSTGTSGANGLVLWTPNEPDESSPLGLFVANSPDGPLANPSKAYCLYETKVPAGYTGIDGPIKVTITAGNELVVDVNDLTITNIPRQGPPLPQTGSSATIVMMLVGLGLIGTAGALFAARRARTSN